MSPPADAVNIQQLVDLCGDDPDGSFMREMVDSYATRGPTLLTSMREALARDDRIALQTLAHQFRGMAGNLGALDVAKRSTALENGLRLNETIDVPASVAGIDEAYQHSLRELQAYAARTAK